MKLSCDCGQVHEFTAGEVERIVHALTGAYADASRQAAAVQAGDPYDAVPCLKEVLGWSYDCEMYSEHVDGFIEGGHLRSSHYHDTFGTACTMAVCKCEGFRSKEKEDLSPTLTDMERRVLTAAKAFCATFRPEADGCTSSTDPRGFHTSMLGLWRAVEAVGVTDATESEQTTR